MKTNKEFNTINKDNLYSTYKDGKPKGILQFLIAHTYQLILITLTGLIIKGLKDINYKQFSIYIIVGAIFGWSWNVFMNQFDPNFPGWLYHHWSIIGWEFGGVVFEDIIFYVVCGGFFYILQNKIPEFGKGTALQKYIVVGVMSLLSILSCIIFGLAGVSITLWFMLTAIAFFIIAKDQIYLGKMFVIVGFVILFASMWDILVITIIPSIKGYAWASSWVYITFDINNIPHHSSLFLDYTNNRWAWIGNSPIEITPWFSICGGFFCYTLAEVVRKLFK